MADIEIELTFTGDESKAVGGGAVTWGRNQAEALSKLVSKLAKAPSLRGRTWACSGHPQLSGIIGK